MRGYMPITPAQQKEMLGQLGMQHTDDLYADVPAEIVCDGLALPKAKSELEVQRLVGQMAAQNHVYGAVFRGAGAYHHYIPSIVKQVASKESFVTAYTPYQAEMNQGILQIFFEFQSEICELTGLDVANASVYDGASAAAEAVAMCKDRKRQKALLAGACNPDTVQVVQTYANAAGDVVEAVASQPDGTVSLKALKKQLDDSVACVYVQSPNYFGVVEDVEAIAELCKEAGAKLIMGCNPTALALYKTPAELGVDIAVGEGQPLGMPLSFGGPYLGFMACTQKLMRRLPGRMVGQTQDKDGKRCFVLTLQAREQHIRREKATSSICTNQAHCALTATVYLAALGAKGLRKVAEQSYAKAHYLCDELQKIGFTRPHKADFYNEFITTCPADSEALLTALHQADILGGLPVDGGILWCCTELNSKEQIDTLVNICRKVAA